MFAVAVTPDALSSDSVEPKAAPARSEDLAARGPLSDNVESDGTSGDKPVATVRKYKPKWWANTWPYAAIHFKPRPGAVQHFLAR